jgi:hypothetical protein
VTADALGQKLMVSMVAHTPRVTKGGLAARLAALQPTLGRQEVEAVWKAVDPTNTGTVEVAALHALLAARFGKDKAAGKGANVIDRVIAKVRRLPNPYLGPYLSPI